MTDYEDTADYLKFMEWFSMRWPQFDKPLTSAFECYKKGREDLLAEQRLGSLLDDEL